MTLLRLAALAFLSFSMISVGPSMALAQRTQQDDELIAERHPQQTASVAQVDDPTDPMQRYFVFKNDAPYPIYPVISSAREVNCKDGAGQLRIVVNDGKRDAGIPHGKSVKVAIPKSYPCATGGFYNASRIYVLLANFQMFNAKLGEEPGTAPQRTTPVAGGPEGLCAGDKDACWVGEALHDYVGDFPGQLLEYTIISQVGPSASPKGPNDPAGISVIDFDVSYVDDVYLPIAMGIDNGLTGFMGSGMGYEDFKGRLTTFLADSRPNWSMYNVYADRNWKSSTIFGPGQMPALGLDKIDKLPSGNVVVVSSRDESIGFSPYFCCLNSAVPPADYQFAACNDGKHNLACSKFDNNQTGNCCPRDSGGMDGCCDIKNFLVDRTLTTFVKAGDDGQGHRIPIYKASNPTFTNMVDRWKKWKERSIKCQASPPATPAQDTVGFCSAFQRTVDFVWDEFVQRGKCAGKRGDALDDCVIAGILGYDLKAANPAKCEKCPALPCPTECVTDIQRNESVQALLRSVPWTPAGDPAACSKCPSDKGDECPLSCVAPDVWSSNATLWHRDKFLHFWAPYDSEYNLNPFARFVHKNDVAKKEGIDAPGAYSFSIDDFYGNYAGPGTTLVVNIGGTSELVNRAPFDPYTQYFVGIGPGWHSANVCGRDIDLPDPSTGLAKNVPFSFWKEDKTGKQPSCEITIYADAEKQEFIKFKVDELSFPVRDTYLKPDQQQQDVLGLGGVFAVRQGQLLNADDNAYCCKESTAGVKGRGKCRANLSPGFLNLAYVGVTECADPHNFTCGRPLMTLNVPALAGGQPDTTCKQ